MDIKFLIENTTLTLDVIAVRAGVSLKHVRKVWGTYPAAFRKARKHSTYSASKLGEQNPMQGKTGEQHPTYVGLVPDGKGYLLVLKPEWYSGRRGSKHVFQHHIVVCQRLGLSAVPAGWVVHHCNGDKWDNRFENLVLMPMGAHTRLHQMLGATTISKESTLKWAEAHSASLQAR